MISVNEYKRNDNVYAIKVLVNDVVFLIEKLDAGMSEVKVAEIYDKAYQKFIDL